jgi:RNA polymerase sigma factor (TIGR02999 family)
VRTAAIPLNAESGRGLAHAVCPASHAADIVVEWDRFEWIIAARTLSHNVDEPSAPASPSDVTRLLQAWSQGNRGALDELMPVVYAELHRLARINLRGERSDHTLQATALVSEAYVRLVGQTRVHWESRAHFFGTAAQLMRRILVDYARRRQSLKRGGIATRVELDDAIGAAEERSIDVLALDQALERLAALDARQSQLVVLRYFGGLTIEEVAEVLAISPATAKREWATARLWLHRELSDRPAQDGTDDT